MAKDKKEKKSKKDKKEKKSKKEKKRKREEISSGSEDEDPEVAAALRQMRRAEMEAKLRKKAEKRRQGKLMDTFGYTNDVNPFGDSNLTQKFVWRKKDDAAKASGGGGKRLKSLRQADQEDEALMAEIEGVRRRRKEREEELAEMERLRDEEARLREAAQHKDWADKEEAFHLEANQTRAKIRLLEGRAEPIDLLARNVLLFGGEKKTVGIDYRGDAEALDISALGAELKAPTEVFHGLGLSQLQRLHGQIDEFARLEGDGGEFRDFWLSLGVVCDAAAAAASRRAEGSYDPHAAFEEAATLEAQVEEELGACSDEALRDLADEVRAEARGGGDEYWDLVATQLQVELARRRLHAMHVKMLTKQLERVAEEKARGQEADAASDAAKAAAAGGSVFFRNVKTDDGGPVDEALDNSTAAIALQRAEMAREMAENEERMKFEDLVDDTRQEVGVAAAIKPSAGPADWADKYKPRKPRFFNRVRTGYDWNLYNRTHYDYDNPPPKTVQGYKFNLFYPDLIDKTITPQYRLEGAAEPQFVLIRFSAGPPYEDIAFKIVNKEWETGRKKGFRCSFERGVLQLHFNFKRPRYRR